MITETGRVIAASGDCVWVQTIRQSACNSCSARQGCGQRVLAGATGGRANQVLVQNHLGAEVGDEVTLAIAESALLGASVLAYAIPLLLFVLGAIAGALIMPGMDAGAFVGSLLGLGAGFVVSRRFQQRHGEDYAPQLLNIQRPIVDSPSVVRVTPNPTDS